MYMYMYIDISCVFIHTCVYTFRLQLRRLRLYSDYTYGSVLLTTYVFRICLLMSIITLNYEVSFACCCLSHHPVDCQIEEQRRRATAFSHAGRCAKASFAAS